jgi:AcrR family transcriptional regulator
MEVLTRKQKETRALKEKVLDEAEKIFVKEGIDQVTMRRIAASIDYAPTVLYRLFANKADLMDHLIARGYNGVRLGYDEVLERKGMSSRELLEGILSVYVDYALSHPAHYVMWFDTGSVFLYKQQLRMVHGGLKFIVFQVWLDRIEACKAEGMFRDWDSLDVFQILWSRVHGMISLRLQHPDMAWMPVAQHLKTMSDLGLN